MDLGQFQYELVEQLSFNRNAGTPEERKAAEILKAKVESLGGTATFEEFAIPSYEILHTKLTVTEPFVREIPVTGIGRSGSLPEGGITAPLLYAERGEKLDLKDAKGKIVLLNGVSAEVYRRLCEAGAVGFLTISGEHWYNEDNWDLEQKYLRDRQLEAGKIPGLTMRTPDAIHMIKDGAKTVKLELQQREFKSISQNVVARIEGTDDPDEVVVLTAHYDSVFYGAGAWDNATGAANIMALYRHFKNNPPRRTMEFIWCGAEEQGLLGSRAYVDMHHAELEKIQFCLNFDMTGNVLGHDTFVTTGDPCIETLAVQLADYIGHTMSLERCVHSSDSACFADKGIPCAGFCRNGKGGYHNRYDQLFVLSAESLARTMRFATLFADRIVNSVAMPVPRVIPDSVKEELEKFFGRM